MSFPFTATFLDLIDKSIIIFIINVTILSLSLPPCENEKRDQDSHRAEHSQRARGNGLIRRVIPHQPLAPARRDRNLLAFVAEFETSHHHMTSHLHSGSLP